jgi:hypothetical protein
MLWGFNCYFSSSKYLIPPVVSADPSKIVPEAKSTFNGPVELAVDYTVYEI